MAEVIAFPLVRRVGDIRHKAALLAWRPYEMGSRNPQRTREKLLAAWLAPRREAMLRRGLAPHVVDQEMRAYETAIRVELARLLAAGNGVA